ncbi:MAG: excinuclease ABC subunit UvrC [Candidatus Dadabacteria bacterium]|nr:excinuclease ABC subunit UvrC [Candidatus Dadabacteria bacterium]
MDSPKPEILKNLPASVGVYLMKDKHGRALYIGKAKNLRSRVRTYFLSSGGDSRPQIPFLVKEICDVDFLVTETERDALLLENSLIKKHKPKYNILLKDDKTYSSLRLDPREKVPRLSFTRRVKNDGAVYFGPFSSGGTLRQTKRLIHKIFPLRDCTDGKYKRHSRRPCLNYNLKLCLGPCAGKVDESTYHETVERAKMFLKGRVKEILKILNENMKRSADMMRYEEAANYRDEIRLLKKNIDIEKIIPGTFNDKDIIGFFRDDGIVEFEVLYSRGGTIVDKAEFSIKNIHWEDREIVREFLGQFYGTDRFIPKEILVPVNIDDTGVMSDWLGEKRGGRVSIIQPKRGAKVKLLELAMKNAEESHKIKSGENAKSLKLLKKVQESLSLTRVPISIECYDISNTQGAQPVASMVRFEHGKPAKKKYRKYRIKSVSGPNDYAMMHEVLTRRLRRSGDEGWELPDLMLVDGGKGQLNIAQQALEELGSSAKVSLASIAKAADQDDWDKIYKPGRKNPLPVPRGSKELLFLMEIRDEAHRFAITYHKKLRKKRSFTSELDLIPGIGPKRKQALLRRFGNTRAIARASTEELSKLPGMNKESARLIKERLNY